MVPGDKLGFGFGKNNFLKRQNSEEKADEDDVNFLYEQREQLVETILLEEENIIGDHRNMIDVMFSSVKQDMELYQSVQQGSKPIIRN